MTSAETAGREAEQSQTLDRGARLGLLAYGVVHLIVAWLALRIAFGDSGGEASGTGALHQLAGNTVGLISLWVVTVGLSALVVWQVLEALVGHRDEEGAKRTAKRLISAGKAVVYGALAVSAVKIALGSRSSGGTDTMTSKLMSAPGGQALVGLVGIGVAAVGCGLLYRGWTDKFLHKLESEGQSGKGGRVTLWLGRAGYGSKGVALLLVGGLFLWAAVSHDPEKSGGLDQALRRLAQAPFGPVLLTLIALGIACYGLFCFAWARHRDE